MNKRDEIYFQAGVIDRFRTTGDVDLLSFFLLMKRQFQNGIFYRYKKGDFSKKTKISLYHEKKMIEKGIKEKLFFYDEKGNIRCISFRKLNEMHQDKKNKKKIYVYIKKTDGLHEVKRKIDLITFKFYIINRQEFVLESRSILLKSDNSRGEYSVKRIKKAAKYGTIERPNANEIIVGYRRISKLLNISISSVKSLLIDAYNIGYIDGFDQVIKKCDGITPEMVEYGIKKKFGHTFAYKGKVFHHYGTRIFVDKRKEVISHNQFSCRGIIKKKSIEQYELVSSGKNNNNQKKKNQKKSQKRKKSPTHHY